MNIKKFFSQILHGEPGLHYFEQTQRISDFTGEKNGCVFEHATITYQPVRSPFGIVCKTIFEGGTVVSGNFKCTVWKQGIFNGGALDCQDWMDGEFNGDVFHGKWHGGFFHGVKCETLN